MRNVNDEVLREIGTKREYIKRKTIVMALINNPKTPLGVSSTLLSRLTNKELAKIYSNRFLPDGLRRVAKRLFEQKTQASGKTIKRKK